MLSSDSVSQRQQDSFADRHIRRGRPPWQNNQQDKRERCRHDDAEHSTFLIGTGLGEKLWLSD
jgi:hypothetical protein